MDVFYEVESRHQHPGNNEEDEVLWWTDEFSTCSPAEELLVEAWDPSGSSVRYWFYDGVTGKWSRQFISRPAGLQAATKSGRPQQTHCF